MDLLSFIGNYKQHWSVVFWIWNVRRGQSCVMNSYSAMADMYCIGKSDRECMQNALCVEMKAAPLALMLVKSYKKLLTHAAQYRYFWTTLPEKKIPPIVRHCPYSVDMPTWRCTLPAEPSPTVYLWNKHIIKLTTVLMGVHFNQRLYHSKSPAAVLTSVLSSTTQTLLLLVFKHADDLQRRPKQLALLWRPSLV